MQSLKFPTALAFLLTAFALPTASFAQVTADDFLPVVQGGPSGVTSPDKVAMVGQTLTAATAQDAVNAATKRNVDAIAAGAINEVGAQMVRFPSGVGFVATGAATYREMENPVATRIAKRKAYVIAFVKAKKSLAEILGGLSNEGKESVRESLVNINLPKEEMTNINTESEESLKQAVDMLLRGFVIYEVKDDTTQRCVYVTIATTPKTRGKLARPAPNVVEADNLRDGLNQVIAEVRSALVPPVGGRIITMRSTGETAFVGFGSSVVRTSKNDTVQLKLNVESQKIAAMRAKDALCGLIIGDKASWKGSVTESMKDQVQEFESLAKDDPLAQKDPTQVSKLDQARETFVARLASSDAYSSARRGILPAGVSTKTWFDADHAWAYGMSVYVPSLTNAAASSAREMRESRILQPINDKGEKAPATQQGFLKPQGEIHRPGSTVAPGPTGRVSSEDQ